MLQFVAEIVWLFLIFNILCVYSLMCYAAYDIVGVVQMCSVVSYFQSALLHLLEFRCMVSQLFLPVTFINNNCTPQCEFQIMCFNFHVCQLLQKETLVVCSILPTRRATFVATMISSRVLILVQQTVKQCQMAFILLHCIFVCVQKQNKSLLF